MSRRRLPAAAALVFAGAVVGAAGVRAAQAEPGWFGRTGDDWKRMTAEARAAWLEGFIAGAATADALRAGAADSAAVVRGVTGLRRTGTLSFRFAPPVYAARLEDYFQWDNHRPQPVWLALWTVDRELDRAAPPAP